MKPGTKVFQDLRGWNFQMDEFTMFSFSKKGVFRGMHFQIPFQKKQIRVIEGAIIDFWVDLKDGIVQWKHLVPFGDALEIPAGYGHGFYAVKDSVVCYKVDVLRNPGKEFTFKLPPTNFHWSRVELILSERDRKAKTLQAIKKEAGI